MADITPIASLNGKLAMPEKVWMQGPPGPQGQQGEPGAAATVTVGTVTTGEPGTDAIVTNIGTESAAVLNFTIPRGATGAVGAVGPRGPKGDTGETGPAGAGVPDGGTVGQLLGKTETGTAWIDPPQSGVSPEEVAAIVKEQFPQIKEQLIVTFSSADMKNWTCDKTLAEITEAINSGKEVVGSVMGTINVDFIGQTPNGNVSFGKVFPDVGMLQSYNITVSEDKVEVIMSHVEMTVMGG